MAAKNNSNLFFTCSLIEFVGRKMKQERKDVTDFLGLEAIAQIYDYADVFHCEPIEKVADEFIEKCQITEGLFDNVAECHYHVPDYWTIGEVYERLVEDSYEEEAVVQGIWEVYHSWISDSISDYNTDFYFQPRDYIAACYECGFVLE
ncbi:MAG: hypothetical protein KHX56_01460 [Clostridiales bacterium]|nr:hypothetical protein [Clostridiales bacterium]